MDFFNPAAIADMLTNMLADADTRESMRAGIVERLENAGVVSMEITLDNGNVLELHTPGAIADTALDAVPGFLGA